MDETVRQPSWCNLEGVADVEVLEAAAVIEVEEVNRHLATASRLELVVFAVFGEHARRAFEQALAGG